MVSIGTKPDQLIITLERSYFLIPKDQEEAEITKSELVIETPVPRLIPSV